ncbi:Uma2 family endonuclease [Streptacidiphilus cavernicola]|uniref:Uma2 family endonuclease n=1 Tax=Streptacidiphilus cavernicola TaxID=3342716 RepID=A0ABV6VSY7_9ACTN
MDYARMVEIADELAKLPESWAVEISGDNVIVIMAPSNPHELNVRRARQQLDPQVQRTRPGWVAENGPEVAVPGVKRKRRPDLVVCRESALEHGTALNVADVLLVLEVVSPGNPESDYADKAVDYPTMGIGEYVILDPRKGTVVRHHGPAEGEDGPRYQYSSTVPFGEPLHLGEWVLETDTFLRYNQD